jgi:hypothetical protein
VALSPQAYGPVNGELIHSPGDHQPATHFTGIRARQFSVRVDLRNPMVSSNERILWDYGLVLADESRRTRYSIMFTSVNSWILEEHHDSTRQPLHRGTFTQSRQPGASTRLDVSVTTDLMHLFANSVHLATLPFAIGDEPLEIGVFTGLMEANELEGKVTRYENLTIRSMP